MTVIDQTMNERGITLCPKCGSSNSQLQATARRAGVVIGGTVGAIIAAGLGGARVGAVSGGTLGTIVTKHPTGTVLGAIGGAMLGFAWGSVAGHSLGAEIDEKVLRRHLCLSCGAEFGT